MDISNSNNINNLNEADKADIEEIAIKIEKINDFPKQGILFFDIFSILRDVGLSQKLFNIMQKLVVNYIETSGKEINTIVGLESRGFLLGLVLADRLKLPFVPIRKKNKLPGSVYKVNYWTEYSQDSFELQSVALNEKSKVLVVDDLLATGGTLKATEELALMAKAEIVAYYVVFEIEFLKGRDKLSNPEKVITMLNL